MNNHRFLLMFFCTGLLLCTAECRAQELQAKVTVAAQRVNSTVDKKIFNTLQTQLTNLLNNRKWTNDAYQPQEKIQCNFLLNLENGSDQNIYKATLTVQAARPVFSSSYQSALVNFQDADFTFKYIEYQPVEFNDSRVQGTDAQAANLTATIAYYVYIILGMDYDSFSPKAGTDYYKKAQNIVNNAPDGRDISGWKTFDGVRNRYWLSENLLNSRFNVIHDVIYSYYRTGLDSLYEDDVKARQNVLDALVKLQTFNQENPNTMFLQFFMQGRSTEFTGIFKNASPDIKARAAEILAQLDVANSTKYKSDLR